MVRAVRSAHDGRIPHARSSAPGAVSSRALLRDRRLLCDAPAIIGVSSGARHDQPVHTKPLLVFHRRVRVAWRTHCPRSRARGRHPVRRTRDCRCGAGNRPTHGCDCGRRSGRSGRRCDRSAGGRYHGRRGGSSRRRRLGRGHWGIGQRRAARPFQYGALPPGIDSHRARRISPSRGALPARIAQGRLRAAGARSRPWAWAWSQTGTRSSKLSFPYRSPGYQFILNCVLTSSSCPS